MVALLIASVVACGSDATAGAGVQAVSRAECPVGTRRVSTEEGVVTLCLPSTFSSRGPRGFARRRGDSLPEHWIAFSVDSTADWSADDPWPLRLASGPGCLADCASVDSVRSIQDTVAGVPAVGEVGLVSGGISGESATPSLVLSADLAGGQRLVINARSSSLFVIDTLLAYAKTVQVVSGPVRRAAP
jgi:hypothetical protein